jgi:hypothetical protein
VVQALRNLRKACSCFYRKKKERRCELRDENVMFK